MEAFRIIALDVGDVRVGVAMSDLSGTIATPHETWLRAKGRAEKEILKLIEQEGTKIVVVGLPILENGQRGEQADKTEKFSRRLLRRGNIEIIYIDEYLSSVEAKEHLCSVSKDRRFEGSKGQIDSASAAVILQRYLDSINNQ